MSKTNEKPVYRQLLETARAGFLALDEPAQKEITAFIKSQQHKNGGFMDRAGNPDLYYSLFGLWLSLATKQNELHQKLKNYISDKPAGNTTSPVEDLALLLIKSELDSNPEKKSIISIVKTVFKKGRLIELAYQFFLITLVIDATGKNKKLYYFVARTWLLFYKPQKNIPCSLSAALVYARKKLGLKTTKMQNELSNFTVPSGGFRAFETVKTSDMLSTGVALFVLKETGTDLRMLAPSGLHFVQENYNSGAFLSGDGDQTKDLEYTFYGLLALGSLVDK